MLPAISAHLVTDAIIDEDWWWNGNITYSIPGPGASWRGYSAGQEPFVGYASLTASQATSFRAAMAAWDALIAPSLKEVSDATPGNIRVAFSGYSELSPYWGYTFAPPYRGGAPDSLAGDIWINRAYATGSFASGTENWSMLLHETGHALGLRHSFETGQIPAGWDTQRYSVMSYTDPVDQNVVSFRVLASGSVQGSYTPVNPSTPMVFDIAAIQERYGRDLTTHAGNDTYRFDQKQAFFRALYDAGGTDTLDLTNFTRPCLIDLRPGAYSSLGQWSVAEQKAYWKAAMPGWASSYVDSVFSALSPSKPFTWTDNFGIAWSTVIENATGGAASDVITGNSAANVLLGLQGNDTLIGAAGNDTLNGNAGADRMDGGAGNDTFWVDNARDLVIEAANGGVDRVNASVSWTLGAAFENLTLIGAGLINAAGNALANIIGGNAAANSLNGGAGNDQLIGGAGNDVLIGGAGLDTLTGSAGRDVFRFTTAPAATTVDKIVDFNVADDTFQLENAVMAKLGATTGVLAAAAFHKSVAGIAHDASDRIIYDTDNGCLYYDPDGNGAAKAILLATLSTKLALTAADFVVI
ncbi:MAG TPA: M10 family metallopeptidase [Mesorhizobium sp.]